MTAAFELDPQHEGARFLFRRNSAQTAQRLETTDVKRMQRLAKTPREKLSADDRDWLDAHADPTGPHLIGMYGLGYYTSAEKEWVDAARAARKQAKEAAAAAGRGAADRPAAPAGATPTGQGAMP
jgi:hypothetical protein